MSSTLGERVAQRDEVAFVGRRPEIERLEALLVADPPASVAFVHGPGGVGKSTSGACEPGPHASPITSANVRPAELVPEGKLSARPGGARRVQFCPPRSGACTPTSLACNNRGWQSHG
jgi:hypothetical protein